MPVDLKALTDEIETAANAAGVYNVDAYGWRNHDEHDPDFVGYAMWATDPPFETDFDAFQNGTTPKRVATATEQRLMELGTDFEGLMKAARYAIGSVLLHRSTVGPWDVGPTPFEYQLINALVSLGMASDRARDLLIFAVLGEEPRAAHELDQYRLAVCTARNRGLNSDADALEGLTPAITRLKSRRNTTVHKMALKAARFQREEIERERRAAKRKRPLRPKARTLPPTWSPPDDEAVLQSELQADTAFLKESYDAVIKSGDLVFRVEYHVRQRQKRT